MIQARNTFPADTGVDPTCDGVRGMLPEETVTAWEVLAPLMPKSAYLAGDTGLTVRLGHRVSDDLEFFLERREDLEALWSVFKSAGKRLRSEGRDERLSFLLNGTKVQVIEASSERLISRTSRVAGVRVASVEDIMAAKIDVICTGGALRDYFDLMCIERRVGLLAEAAIALAVYKYERRDAEEFVIAVLRSLGGFYDVKDDPSLAVSRDEIQSYWLHRQIEVARRLEAFS
ncbi:MAG: nucleotidyl transferase AbiEii/AbiGii toxin family protein [Actinobacteria bacterium]|nr:nucleotidyl transferase AbiEii/AbiGii toxin family protein [Actinomycetota bacterium]